MDGGAPFDTLAKKYHDYAGKEETNILTPWVRDSLPASYQKAFLLRKAAGHRHVPDPRLGAASRRSEVRRRAVAHGGRGGRAHARRKCATAVRSELAQRGGIRRYIDTLKKQTYVAVHLDGRPADNRRQEAVDRTAT